MSYRVRYIAAITKQNGCMLHETLISAANGQQESDIMLIKTSKAGTSLRGDGDGNNSNLMHSDISRSN